MCLVAHEADVDTGELRSLVVAAAGIDVAAELRIFHDVPQDQIDHCHDNQAERDCAKDLAVADEVEHRAFQVDIRAVGRNVAEAAKHELHAHRRNHGANLQVADQKGVDCAQRHTEQHDQKQCHIVVAACVVEDAKEHTSKARHGELRNVHAAEKHTDRQAGGHSALDGFIRADGHDVPHRKEIRIQAGEQDHHQDQRNQGTDIAL